jgi:hypothetical protein
MALEIMDAMNHPKRYRWIYLFSYFYIFTLTLPHSISVQLAFPQRSLKNGSPSLPPPPLPPPTARPILTCK